MTRKYTTRTEIEVLFTPPGAEDQESSYPEIEIVFSYSPGAPEQGPSYASGGQPAEPPEVEFISAKLIEGHGIEPTQAQIDDWADDWLASDTGYQAAIDEVVAHHEGREE